MSIENIQLVDDLGRDEGDQTQPSPKDEDQTQQSPKDEELNEDGDDIEVGEYNTNREFKDWLVARLLCRWWYVLPDWPPINYNYYNELERNKLKVYDIEEFEEHENVDVNGYLKAYQCTAFPGVFRDYTGKAYDLRPEEGKPCYNNFIKFSNVKLFELVEGAIKKQLDILEKSKYNEEITINLLKEELNEVITIKNEQNKSTS